MLSEVSERIMSLKSSININNVSEINSWNKLLLVRKEIRINLRILLIHNPFPHSIPTLYFHF